MDEYTHLLFFSLLTCVRSVLDELLRCNRSRRDIHPFTLVWCATLKRLVVQYKRSCMHLVWVLFSGGSMLVLWLMIHVLWQWMWNADIFSHGCIVWSGNLRMDSVVAARLGPFLVQHGLAWLHPSFWQLIAFFKIFVSRCITFVYEGGWSHRVHSRYRGCKGSRNSFFLPSIKILLFLFSFLSFSNNTTRECMRLWGPRVCFCLFFSKSFIPLSRDLYSLNLVQTVPCFFFLLLALLFTWINGTKTRIVKTDNPVRPDSIHHGLMI